MPLIAGGEGSKRAVGEAELWQQGSRVHMCTSCNCSSSETETESEREKNKDGCLHIHDFVARVVLVEFLSQFK